MKKTVWLCLAALVCALNAFALGEVETAGGARITPANGSTFYNPTGITIGNYLYVYMQGSDPTAQEASCPSGDKIIAYRALITNGVPGTFERVGRISPCVNAPVGATTASYGPGQVFEATLGGVTKYHLLADASDTLSFYNVWRAESTDGINWTWHISSAVNNSQFTRMNGCAASGKRSDEKKIPGSVGKLCVATGLFGALAANWPAIPDRQKVLRETMVDADSFIHSTSVFILNPIMLSTNPGTNNAQWWGFFNYWSGTTNVGEWVINWDATGTVPTVRVVTNVSGGTYTFTNLPYSNGTSTLNVTPWAFLTRAGAKTLLFDTAGNNYQLWTSTDSFANYDAGNVNCNVGTTLTCTNPNGCLGGDGSTCPNGAVCHPFLRNTGVSGEAVSGNGSGFYWYPVTRFTFGGQNLVTSNVRYLPSGYELARAFPFRWNSPTGKRYLFSVTNDANICTQFLFSGFYKMYVVSTELSLQ